MAFPACPPDAARIRITVVGGYAVGIRRADGGVIVKLLAFTVSWFLD